MWPIWVRRAWNWLRAETASTPEFASKAFLVLATGSVDGPDDTAARKIIHLCTAGPPTMKMVGECLDIVSDDVPDDRMIQVRASIKAAWG